MDKVQLAEPGCTQLGSVIPSFWEILWHHKEDFAGKLSFPCKLSSCTPRASPHHAPPPPIVYIYKIPSASNIDSRITQVHRIHEQLVVKVLAMTDWRIHWQPVARILLVVHLLGPSDPVTIQARRELRLCFSYLFLLLFFWGEGDWQINWP